MKQSKIRRYYFRADGNGRIGAGHLMRCLTIAQTLAQRMGGGERICFLTADGQSAQLVQSRAGQEQTAFRIHVLGTSPEKMEEELPFLEAFFQAEDFQKDGDYPDGGSRAFQKDRDYPDGGSKTFLNCILVDSYFVTDRYLAALGSFGEVWLLDDMEQQAYSVDGVINYNVFASLQKYQELYQGSRTACYLGSRYVPVRRQFLDQAYQVRPSVGHVLVTTGGGDQENLAAKVLEAVWQEGIHYHVVVGCFHPAANTWKTWEKAYLWLHVHVDVTDMAGLMKDCDLAVTAGGTTIYELAALGVPFLCFSYAENQEALTQYVGRNRIGGYAGAFHKEPEAVLTNLRNQMHVLLENNGFRYSYSQAEKKLVDGRGADRIADLLLQGVVKTEDLEEENRE